jgi:hypothetical protein
MALAWLPPQAVARAAAIRVVQSRRIDDPYYSWSKGRLDAMRAGAGPE